MNSTIEPLNLNEEMNLIERITSRIITSRITSPQDLNEEMNQIERITSRIIAPRITSAPRNTSSQDAYGRIRAPFVTVRNRRQIQIEQNIIENSPELRELYFENQSLRRNLTEIMRNANHTRHRMINVSREYDELLRRLVKKQKEEEKNKLKIICLVKAKKQLYSKIETHCGICLENHQYIDVCTLPCNHEYGTKCFEKWYTKGARNCPECRNPTKEIKTYRMTAERKIKTNISPKNVLSPSPDVLPLPDFRYSPVDVLSPSPDVLPFPDL
jgi:hypothetical protein